MTGSDARAARARRAPARGSRGRALVVGVLSAVLVVVLGATVGGTLAYWRDTVTVSTRIPVGAVVFGARAVEPGVRATYATGSARTVQATIGRDAAATLYATGAVAVVLQVDSLVQGHRGLRYTVTDDVSGGVLGAATRRLFPVPTAAACTTGATGPARSTSTPWSAAYSSATTPVSEYWCLVATFDRVQGTYANTASVVADVVPEQGATVADGVTGRASWSAQVLSPLDPAAEPTQRVSFRFETFRTASS